MTMKDRRYNRKSSQDLWRVEPYELVVLRGAITFYPKFWLIKSNVSDKIVRTQFSSQESALAYIKSDLTLFSIRKLSEDFCFNIKNMSNMQKSRYRSMLNAAERRKINNLIRIKMEHGHRV